MGTPLNFLCSLIWGFKKINFKIKMFYRNTSEYGGFMVVLDPIIHNFKTFYFVCVFCCCCRCCETRYIQIRDL